MGIIPGTDFVELGARPEGAHLVYHADLAVTHIRVDDAVVGWYTDEQAATAQMYIDWNEVMGGESL